IDLWNRVRALAAEVPADHARLEHLVFDSFDGHRLRLTIDTADPGLGRWLATQTKPLAEMVRQATARSVVVEIDTGAVEAAAGPREVRTRIDEAQELPMVKRAMEIFDATVVDVQDAPATEPSVDAAGSSEHV
ncbi:MAG: hypothetical protein ACYSU7_15645, partial [Planctomycetota bacterium]